MAETPDFDAYARRIVELTDLALVREQLVLLWNARGIADIVTLQVVLDSLGVEKAGSYAKALDRALRKLNR